MSRLVSQARFCGMFLTCFSDSGLYPSEVSNIMKFIFNKPMFSERSPQSFGGGNSIHLNS